MKCRRRFHVLGVCMAGIVLVFLLKQLVFKDSGSVGTGRDEGIHVVDTGDNELPPIDPGPQVVDSSTIQGKVICGYQGWFGTPQDGSEVNAWMHWSRRIPSPEGGVTFELFPDTREYPKESLFDTSFMPLGDGRYTQLFSSYSEGTIDLHFRWMRDYGIDGVALQRFGTEVAGPNKSHFDTVANNVKKYSEKYGRIFYLTYDLSGMTQTDWTEVIRKDWETLVDGASKLTQSSQYLKQQGKPIVQLWGIGVDGNFKRKPEEALELIQWFKQEGYYVIGGLPTHWRKSEGDSLPGFEEAYSALDMVSPWTVGRFRTVDEAEKHYTKVILPDMEYCAEKGLDYMPVIYPGFAWSNWNGGEPNMISRQQGKFLWTQAYQAVKSKAQAIYVAMFDEYDEGTAIAKAAEDSSMIPIDAYFLTTSADGSFISSDFYLRLVNKISRMLKRKDEPSPEVPVPLTIGPVYLRTGFEKGLDPLPYFHSKDFNIYTNMTGKNGKGKPVCILAEREQYHMRKGSLKFEGSADKGNSHADVGIFHMNFKVSADTKLRFWKYAETEEGMQVTIDIIAADGSRLSNTSAQDRAGNSMKPGKQKTEMGKWVKVECDVSKWMEGKIIKALAVTYKGTGQKRDVVAYFDDVLLTDGGF